MSVRSAQPEPRRRKAPCSLTIQMRMTGLRAGGLRMFDDKTRGRLRAARAFRARSMAGPAVVARMIGVRVSGPEQYAGSRPATNTGSYSVQDGAAPSSGSAALSTSGEVTTLSRSAGSVRYRRGLRRAFSKRGGRFFTPPGPERYRRTSRRETACELVRS